ncbi:hypothetical protein CLOACE_06330 [Clostridium acetireducens DSM 10703]|jgi:hypothetical protein|uniref:CobQ/CobB/MinD/ParA nucleotide binding domain protein n=1 Tax=Clostridium acetireducens DSM 10703 TaxID=1121290 RepID=A0A1E8F080_9CLOT|nr:ATP-binding protein [Clostridium acetireducens]OFI06840.1 hypothetical protein CLOACE_06330 [Clostridium acetireducens DSM 10703]
MSRIRIFTGHFGSGKTEIAINYAINLAKTGKKTAIVDLDIVNPYFCTRSVKDILDKYGIRLISADPNLSNAELMVVTPEVYAAFNDKSYETVIDVGGDDQGAIALGQYNRYFKDEPYDMYFVINNNRPLTSKNKDVETYLKEIEMASRLKVNGLISNANLSYETEPKHIIEGDKNVHQLSKSINIPHKYTVCRKDLVDKIKDKVEGEVLPIDVYMKPPWR